VLSADGQESLSFKEEWAIRAGQYGANNTFENIEFVLDEGQFKINPQGFYLVNQPDLEALDYIIRQTPSNVYLKPLGYNSTPWPVLKNYQPYLRQAGYVRPIDVAVSLKTIDDIVNYDVANFNNGSYIWCSFEKASWNIYRFTDVNFKVTDVTYDNNVLTITLFDLVTLPVDSWIGIGQTSAIDGFYKITSVTLNSFTVTATITNWTPFTEQSSIIVYALLPQRSLSIDEIDNIIPRKLSSGELLWTDNDGSGNWSTWVYNPVYKHARLFNSDPATGLGYGRSVSISHNGLILGVSTANGEVVTWDKPSVKTPWIQRQLILKPFVTNQASATNQYATVVTFSHDGAWMATGSPTLGSAYTRYRGQYDASIINYLTGDIISVVPPSTEENDYLDAIYLLEAYFAASNWTGVGYPASRNSYQALISSSNPSINPVWIPQAKQIVDAYLVWQASLTNVYFYRALQDLLPGRTPPTGQTSNLYWESIPYIPIDDSGSSSGLTAQGVVHLYKKDSDNIYTLVDSFVSPRPASNELFGSSITFFTGKPFGSTNTNFTDQLIVGAPGSDSYYTFAYGSVAEKTTAFNPVGTVGGIISVTSTLGILPGMVVSGTGFTGGQTVLTVLSSTKLELTGSPNSTPSGVLTFSVNGWFFDTVHSSSSYNLPIGRNFGSNIVPSGDYKSAYALSLMSSSTPGYVLIVSAAGTKLIAGTSIKFGTAVALSNDATYVAISDTLATDVKVNQGAVYVYKLVNGNYTLYQTLVNHNPENSGFFGSKLAFMTDKTLVVFNSSGDTYNSMTLDSDETTFDKKSTTFVTKQIDSGRVDVYDNYSSKWVFSETMPITNELDDGYGTGFSVGANHIIVSSPNALDQSLSSGAVFDYYKTPGTYTWTKSHSEITKPDVSKIKKAYLYNRKTGKLITYLDVIDPLQGKIAGPAREEITYSSFYDPAVYSIGDDSVTVDTNRPWTSEPVGKIWWDLKTAKFIEPYDTDIVYRTSSWNSLATGASIDIYECV
jgi:hypothetical protein